MNSELIHFLSWSVEGHFDQRQQNSVGIKEWSVDLHASGDYFWNFNDFCYSFVNFLSNFFSELKELVEHHLFSNRSQKSIEFGVKREPVVAEPMKLLFNCFIDFDVFSFSEKCFNFFQKLIEIVSSKALSLSLAINNNIEIVDISQYYVGHSIG